MSDLPPADAAPSTQTGGSGGPGPLRLAVTTPWYPGANNAFAGVFVQHAIEAVQAVDADAVDVRIIHAEDWATPKDPMAWRIVRAGMHALLAPGSPAAAPVRVREGELLRVRVPAVPRRGALRHATFHVDEVRRLLPGGVIDADVLHAHEGLFGGLVATRLAAPETPIVVTEHDTRLKALLTSPDARSAYRDIIERSSRFFAVSEMLADQIRGYIPACADRIEVLPNAVAFEQMPMRQTPVSALDRWLYVGRLNPHKGVRRLVSAFAACAQDNPRLTLTMIGSGPLQVELAQRAHDLGVGERVDFRGPVPHEGVRAAMQSHDLLVHLSERETFGMTIVEAISTGLPVLVTRSGGPQETLEGLGTMAGRLIDVGTNRDGWDIDEVVETYHDMANRIEDLDLHRAREILLDRYGQISVGRRLLEVYQQLRTGKAAS
ncbi:MAG: glycosyltransferase [Actinomycetia bacterium]|nr:glycosyltransferase [Actinomycetes bacterium]